VLTGYPSGSDERHHALDRHRIGKVRSREINWANDQELAIAHGGNFHYVCFGSLFYTRKLWLTPCYLASGSAKVL